jgi:hypothetical protein
MVVPAYRLHNTQNPPADANSDGNKAAFWILQITMEWLAATSLLAVNAKEWCGVQETSKFLDSEARGVYQMPRV